VQLGVRVCLFTSVLGYIFRCLHINYHKCIIFINYYKYLYPPSELSETGGYTVFTFVCLSVSVCVHTHLNGRNHVLFAEKSIRLVCEKLRIFPYGQYIVGIYVSLAFWQYSQVQDRSGA